MTRGVRALAVLATGVGALLTGCGEDRLDRIQASGTVEATDTDLGFQAAGRIEAVLVREGDSVQEGEEVALLDRGELLARKRGMEAQRDAAQALLDELQAGFRPEEVQEGRAALRQAEERLEDAARDLDRAQILFDGGAISRETMDKAQTAFGVAVAAADQARQRARLLEEGVRAERIAAQRAAVEQTEAGVAQIHASLRNFVVMVPFPGIVTQRHREPGETVSPGAPVLTVMDPEDRWVRIYVPENRIGEVQLGQPATISSDTYPDRRYDGEVIFIASESEFTPRNVQTPEERVKLVYAVKVRITGDPTYDLKPGIPADVVLGGGSNDGSVRASEESSRGS